MERLKELREQKGLSREVLAVGADMSPVTLWRYETGQRSPTAEQLEKLAEVMGVEVADFFPKAQASLPFDELERRYRVEDLAGQSTEWEAYAELGELLVKRWEADAGRWGEVLKDLLPYKPEAPLIRMVRAPYARWAMGTMSAIEDYLKTVLKHRGKFGDDILEVGERMLRLHREIAAQGADVVPSAGGGDHADVVAFRRQLDAPRETEILLERFREASSAQASR